jgi:ceramide glucosyltransferase
MPLFPIPGWALIPLLGTICGIGYWLFSLRCAVSFRPQPIDFRKASFNPPVSILKPLCGMDPHAYESLRSHCVQDYPEFEIIFGVADSNDEIIPAVRKLIAEFPRVPITLVQCPQRLGSNLKVSNLIQMLPSARHEFLVINDSDIRVPEDYLHRVITPLENSTVGLITCLFRAVAGRSLCSKLEALGISSDFVPGVLCARRLEGGIRFGLGSTLAFSRQALEKIGGLTPLADFLADDYQLGYRMSQAGFRVEFADCIVDHYLPEYSFRAFLQHQLRWARTVRASRPGGYAGLVFTLVLPWSLLTILLMPVAILTWVLFALAVLLRYAVWFAIRAYVLRDSRSNRDAWLLPIRDLISLAVWFLSYMGREVVWRGRRFELANGKLRPV